METRHVGDPSRVCFPLHRLLRLQRVHVALEMRDLRSQWLLPTRTEAGVGEAERPTDPSLEGSSTRYRRRLLGHDIRLLICFKHVNYFYYVLRGNVLHD